MICACYRHTNKVVVIHSYQLYGVRLEGFHSWQRVFFLYLYPFVPDGAEKDCIEIPCLLCGDRGYTAALYLPPPGHRNYFVDLHIVYPGDDTRGTLCLNLYRYNESQRIDCGYVLAKNTSEHYHYIRYGATLFPYQVMLDRYQQTIRELHIEKLKDRNLFDLSGGQKQTIAFASVYALNPDIFVLDEPSSNLDPEAIQELRRLLLLIKSQGKTIVVSEHRLYFLNGIADRIVLMEHGKLKQSWSARDFALLSTEQIKALGLRSYTPARLELPETMPSRNDTPAVEVKDLAIGYEKGKPVAQHLNFRVYPGEIVGVVGKNGCGKSTLARTLCGLQKELRGEVLYQNSMIPSKRRIRKAYLVMQDPDYAGWTWSWRIAARTPDTHSVRHSIKSTTRNRNFGSSAL